MLKQLDLLPISTFPRCDTITDPLKKIELFKALASPAFIGDKKFMSCMKLNSHKRKPWKEKFRWNLKTQDFNSLVAVASLENCNETSAEFFCPVKMCFEFACEANFRLTNTDISYCFLQILFSSPRKATIPEYKREYEEIEIRYDTMHIQGFLFVTWDDDEKMVLSLVQFPRCWIDFTVNKLFFN